MNSRRGVGLSLPHICTGHRGSARSVSGRRGSCAKEDCGFGGEVMPRFDYNCGIDSFTHGLALQELTAPLLRGPPACHAPPHFGPKFSRGTAYRSAICTPGCYKQMSVIFFPVWAQSNTESTETGSTNIIRDGSAGQNFA